MSDDLIDPDAIPVPIVNTVLLESAAGGLRTDGENIAESGQSIKSSWAGLQAVYSAPEAETLYSAVDPVATTGDSVETDFGTAATALETFAERARELRSELVQARQDARDLVAEIRSDDDWDDGGFFGGESDKVEEHNNLLNHVNSLHQQYQEAERECANAITALFGGTTFIASNADGTTQPDAGEAVYGFEEAPEDVGTPWGSPQGTDHMWYVDAIHGGGDVLMGSLEDMGGAVGIHGSEGWFTGDWGDNFTSYWGDSIAGLGAMTGFYNPQTGEMVNSPGEWWDTARGAWGDAIHGFFPWTELGERPGYVFGTVLTNIGMIAGGVALSATGVGAVVGVPMIAARVSRILGGAGTGDGPISGDIDPGGSEGSDGSSHTANNGSSPTLRPDGTHPDAPTAPDSIEPDGSGVPAGLGDMHESLSDLEAHQNQGPQADPAPVPDNRPDPTSEPSTPLAEPVTPESNPPERPESDRDGTGSQDADTPGQRADEDVRPDPTTAEVDAAFSEIARRNEDLADDMDTADGGRMAELDGEAPWTIDALENSGSAGRGDGPGGNENSRVPVTPDGMEMHADGTIDNSADGDGPRPDEDSDPVTVHEDADPSTGDSSSGGPPSPPRPPGPDFPAPGGDSSGAEWQNDSQNQGDTEDETDADVLNSRPGDGYYLNTLEFVDIGYRDISGSYVDESGNRFVDVPQSPEAADTYRRIRESPESTHDVQRNTGYDLNILDQMRDHLFQREHVIPGPPTGALRDGHFAPMNHIAELWQLAESGEINLPENRRKAEHFHRLVMHEYVESRLMEAGMPYRAHGPEMWDDGVYFPRRDQHGAHDMAPLEYNADIFRLWRGYGITEPDFEIADDLSNLDDIVDIALKFEELN